jgi:hypothetical protein
MALQTSMFLPQRNGVFYAVHAEMLYAEWVSGRTAGVQLCCELLLGETGSWGWGQFGNPEEGERLPSKAATKQ